MPSTRNSLFGHTSSDGKAVNIQTQHELSKCYATGRQHLLKGNVVGVLARKLHISVCVRLADDLTTRRLCVRERMAVPISACIVCTGLSRVRQAQRREFSAGVGRPYRSSIVAACRWARELYLPASILHTRRCAAPPCLMSSACNWRTKDWCAPPMSVSA